LNSVLVAAWAPMDRVATADLSTRGPTLTDLIVGCRSSGPATESCVG
jgi:hypothetical protein